MAEIFATFGIDWKLLLVQVVNFGVLLAVLWYVLYRPVIRLVRERQEHIAQGVRDAEAAQQERERIEQERNERLTAASKEAEAVIEQARDRAQEKEAQLVADAQARSERIIQESTERATDMKEQALAESQDEIARLAVLAAEKVLRERKHTANTHAEHAPAR